jgi:hypothetical protein
MGLTGFVWILIDQCIAHGNMERCDMTSLYKVNGSDLVPIQRQRLASEDVLEGWIARDPLIIGLDVLVLGQQVVTDFNGRIDILAIDREGDLVVIELKRDRTPRDIVAQILDYASWVGGLTTRRIHEIALDKLGQRLEAAFSERYDVPLPETLNGNHSMVIVASEFDGPSKRIVEYLNTTHSISINTAFFNLFEEDGEQFLATDWLMDQQEVEERAVRRTAVPWTGYYYVNSGHNPDVRDWEDMREHGFIAAGYGRFYSKRLEQLSAGDAVYVYERGEGYIGFGIVRSPTIISQDFRLADGRSLEEMQIRQPAILHHPDDPELADYVVGVDWKKTLPVSEGKTFTGAFANQNVVCKLRAPATLEFLAREFGSIED